jgi:hypothetical protein
MLTAPEVRLAAGQPDRAIMVFRDLPEGEARYLATDALYRARHRMPRVTGMTARALDPLWGRRWFGLGFPPVAWYLSAGTGPRTMHELAGKTIPMWITDVDGSLRRASPKAKVRSTDDGRTQVLIFRKAAKLGARKTMVSKWGTTYSAPASYPGAPGRIARRTPGMPWTPTGGVGGAAATGNVGVRWRHPGVRAMQFLNAAMAEAAFDAGLIVEPIYVADAATMGLVLTRKVG